MTSAVLDSSAVLAYLEREPGATVVERYFGDSLISGVNAAEVFTKLVLRGATLDIAKRLFDGLDIAISDFTRDLAKDAGALVAQTKPHGLSLGDRACLALARREHLSVLTAARAWKDVDVGVEIRVIR